LKPPANDRALRAALGPALAATLAAAGEPAAALESLQPAGSGSFSHNFRAVLGGRDFFLKLAPAASARFSAEAEGLATLMQCAALRIPRVFGQGQAAGVDYLLLEWLAFDATENEALLGEALAALHSLHGPRYGWGRDNFIGASAQENGWAESWSEFFRDRRLLPQLRLAERHGAPELLTLAAPLLASLPRFFADGEPPPSLLHGDLWAGNKGFVGGRPCLFDPAVYAGDAETDLAMAALFGGFGPLFLAAYHAILPRREGDVARRGLYQLYHVLNHFNLFGGHYRGEARRLIAHLRA
jgi:fructosamine-3-kinase